MIFLQKKRDSKRNLFLKLKNIICYYQTILIPESFSSAKIFQNIICYYQTRFRSFLIYSSHYFKTSYVITKLGVYRYAIISILISKHHMLLPNLNEGRKILTAAYFKTSYVITKRTYSSVYCRQL